MTPLVSILCPSRRRFAWLKRCVKSIVGNACDQTCFEIIVRAHSDDEETIRGLWELLACKQVRVVIGGPLGGYQDLSRFYDECAALAQGKWIWVMNDDVIVDSPAWDEAIRMEEGHSILMPEHHFLSGRDYMFDKHTPFMFVPNKCWKNYGVERFETPFDEKLWTLLRDNGWLTRFVPITVRHTRKNDQELENEREPFPTRQDSAELQVIEMEARA